ncbi:MAG: fumarylacetoacetate hydrolase family protein [Pseudomonadota bacterium]
MKLVTINNTAQGSPGALLRSGDILHLGRAAAPGTLEGWIPPGVRGILEAGEEGLAVVRQLVSRIEAAPAGFLAELKRSGAITAAVATPLLAPVPNPRLMVAAGLAFKSHLAEMAGTPAPAHPTGFMKSSNSITGPDAPILIPPHANACVDYEGELAVVFGRTCHDVSAAYAMSFVAGYMAANDVSARDWVKPVWEAKEPWQARQTWETNIMGKQFDSFTPLGPVLTTADEIPDVTALQIETRLNGQVMQRAPISDLIFSLAETIAHFSRWYTFQPGDILLTGTPAGVGVGRKPPVFMKTGDVIEVEISGVGILRNMLVPS